MENLDVLQVLQQFGSNERHNALEKNKRMIRKALKEKLFAEEAEQVEDEVEERVSKKIAKKTSYYILNTLSNASVIHKGNSEDMIKFFNQPSFNATMKMIDFLGDIDRDPETIYDILDELDLDKDELANIHQVEPKPDHKIYKLYKKNLDKIEKGIPTRITRNFVEFFSVYDDFSETLYLTFAPTIDESLNSSAIGTGFYKTITDKTKFKFNAHGGKVVKAYQDVYEPTRDIIKELMDKHSPYNIVLNGHSQGGSIATLAAGDEIFKGKNITVNAVAPGVVGDRKFINGLKENVGKHFDYNRIGHKKDPIQLIGYEKFRHVSNEVWDVSSSLSSPEEIKNSKFPSFKELIEKPIKETGEEILDAIGDRMENKFAMHRQDAIFARIKDIQNGKIPMNIKKGSFVNKGAYGAITKVAYGLKMDIFDAIVFSKTFLKDHGKKGFDILKENFLIKNELFNKVKSNILDLYKKAGYDEVSGFIKNNSLTKRIFNNFDGFLAAKIKATDLDVYKELTENLDKKSLNLLEKSIDSISNQLEDIVLKFDSLSSKNGSILGDLYGDNISDLIGYFEKEGFNNDEMDMLKTSYIEFNDDLPITKNVKLGKEIINDLNYPPLKVQPFRPLKEKVVNAVGNIGTNIIDRGDSMIKKNLDVFKDFKTKLDIDIKAIIANLEQKIKKNIISDNYVGVSNDLIPKVTALDVNVKFGPFDNIGKIVYNKIKTSMDKFKPITGVSGIKKGLANEIAQRSKTGLEASVAMLKKLIQKSGKFGTTSLKMASKLKKILAKSAPVIGVALEIGFTVDEIDSDLERIENEKEYILWNGEVIFKLYNPDEYEELQTMHMIYLANDLENIVDYDTFVNTWFGRLSTDEYGNVIIDGVRTDDPNFDIVYEKLKLDVRGDGKEYTGESKTLSVLKNVGLAAFNILMDVANISTGAQVGSGLATGIIDEIFEQQAINKKSNGYNRALKFKILQDGYLEIINDISGTIGDGSQREEIKENLMKYFTTLMKADSTTMDSKVLTEQLKPIRDKLRVMGLTDDMMRKIYNHIKTLEKTYDNDPDVMLELMKMVPLSVFSGYEFIGTNVLNSVINMLNLGQNELDSIKAQRKAISNAEQISKDILYKYFDERGKKHFKDVGVRVYSDDFWERVTDLNYDIFIENDNYLAMAENGHITYEQYRAISADLYDQYAFQLQIMDVFENPYKSKYKDDPKIIEFIENFEQERYRDLINSQSANFTQMSELVKLHQGNFVGETQDPTDEGQDGEVGNLFFEMNETILNAKIDILLKNSGKVEGDDWYDYLKELLKEYYRGLNPNSFSPRDEKITVDIQKVINRGIKQQAIDELLGNNINLEFLHVENSIAKEYYKMAKILDVFYDPRSAFKDEEDIIQYFKDNDINMDRDTRLEEIEKIKIHNAVEKTRVETHNKLTEEYNQKLKELNDEYSSAFEKQGEEYQKAINELYDKLKEYEDEINTNRRQRYGLDKINNASKDDEANLAQEHNDVLDERQQFDFGLADKEETQAKFVPTGKLLPFTLDDGPPRMLFENGDEKSYTGPKNALAGGINQGYWTGAIPNASHAPINIVDNYFMAYHIEAQTEPDIARLRFVSRLTAALNNEEISPEKDLVEYEIAVYTLEYLHRNQHLFGLEITNEFMKNGLGAVVNAQLYEDDRSGGVLKGELPKDFDSSQHMDIEIEDDVKNPLKRAADLAEMIGDDMMRAKFRKISFEKQNMERIAKEYIDKLRESLKGGGININQQDRLTLENSIKVETLEEKYTKELINILGKQLFEFL